MINETLHLKLGLGGLKNDLAKTNNESYFSNKCANTSMTFAYIVGASEQKWQLIQCSESIGNFLPEMFGYMRGLAYEAETQHRKVCNQTMLAEEYFNFHESLPIVHLDNLADKIDFKITIAEESLNIFRKDDWLGYELTSYRDLKIQDGYASMILTLSSYSAVLALIQHGHRLNTLELSKFQCIQVMPHSAFLGSNEPSNTTDGYTLSLF